MTTRRKQFVGGVAVYVPSGAVDTQFGIVTTFASCGSAGGKSMFLPAAGGQSLAVSKVVEGPSTRSRRVPTYACERFVG